MKKNYKNGDIPLYRIPGGGASRVAIAPPSGNGSTMTTIYHPPPFQRGNIAQRIIGRLIKDGQKAGEIADEGNITGNNQYGNVPKEDISTPATLEELGLTRKQSSIYQLAEPYMKEAKFRQEATLKQNRDTVFPISEKREEPIHTVELLAEKAGRKEA